MTLLNKLDKCTGCTACASVCAKDAIIMAPNPMGFMYPFIDSSKCVDCGLCQKVCPKETDLCYPQEDKYVMYGVSTNEDTIMTSSSGGAFSEIINLIEREHPAFHCYAASFTDGQVKHICISCSTDLFKQKKSKYTQSDLSDTFRRIKEDLSKQLYVVFVGTPCQVDGLKCFLRQKQYDNLLTIDLLCTGACSPISFRNHVKYLEQKHNQDIVGYDMRKKIYTDGRWHIMKSEILYQNGESEEKEKDMFVGCFRQHVAFRDSCYQCKYTSLCRAGDITLGDYWKHDPDFSENGFRGISTIIANNEQGRTITYKLKSLMALKETTIEDIKSQQPALNHPVERPSYSVPLNVDTLGGSVKFMKRYYRGGLKIRILTTVSHLLPTSLSSILKKVYYTISKSNK